MLDIEPDILNFKFEEDPSLSLWTDKESPQIGVGTQKIGRKTKLESSDVASKTYGEQNVRPN